MEIKNYLNSILKKEKITDDSLEIKKLQAERGKVEKIITGYFEDKPVIRYAGSYKKDTMIKSSYDLDITCYFKYDDNSAGETLGEIYENVKKSLENNYTIREKKSALRLMGDGSIDFNIDVVPGRFVDDSQNDVFLHQSSGEKDWMKTNLDKHVNHIKNSQLTDTIKLVKLWRNIYAVDVKTFALELLVVKILNKRKDSDGLTKCFTDFMGVIAESVDNIAIEDPANSGNDLSNIFDSSVKNILLSAAQKTLEAINDDKWEDIFGAVVEESSEYKLKSVHSEYERTGNSPRPWLDI